MSFCCYAGDMDPADMENEVWRKARKIHTCCECYAKIQVGEEYQLVSLLSSHEWYKYKSCEKCADLRASLDDVTCVQYEGLRDAFTEWLTHGDHTVMRVKEGSHAARLAPGYFVDDEGE